MPKGKDLTIESQKFIRQNWKDMTDKVMSEKLNVPADTIQKFRKRHAMMKQKGARSKIEKRDLQAIDTELAEYKNATDSDCRRIFDREFRNTYQYEMLLETLTEWELKFYMQEFITYIIEVREQGGRFTTSEYRAIDYMIMTRIRQFRLSKQEKMTMDEVLHLRSSIKREENKTSPDMEEVANMRARLLECDVSMKGIARDHKILGDQFDNTQNSLDITRKERLKRMTDQSISVLTLVEELQNQKRRENVSKYADLLNKAKKKIQADWIADGVLITGDSNEK